MIQTRLLLSHGRFSFRLPYQYFSVSCKIPPKQPFLRVLRGSCPLFFSSWPCTNIVLFNDLQNKSKIFLTFYCIYRKTYYLYIINHTKQRNETKNLSIMKNYPFTAKEIQSYMDEAMDWVYNNKPSVVGSSWDDAVRERLRIAHNGEKNMNSHDALMFADLIWDGYYEDLGE